jgi:SAM-dependent methyltransferase
VDGPQVPDDEQDLNEGKGAAEIFVAAVRDYAHRHAGNPICLLEAGCGRRAGDLGVGSLRAAGVDIRVDGIDHDHPLTRDVTAARGDLRAVTLGDLRTVPLAPRSYDVVHSAGLLERIRHVELVLDRLVAALKPGGLFLLRIADRACAAGAVDRFAAALPGRAREHAWRQLRPGEPGPYPAVYEDIVSGPGIQGFALMRGLVIAERQASSRDLAGTAMWSTAVGVARRLAAGASRGRFPDDHDELLFVMRKPEDRFARVLLRLTDSGDTMGQQRLLHAQSGSLS